MNLAMFGPTQQTMINPANQGPSVLTSAGGAVDGQVVTGLNVRNSTNVLQKEQMHVLRSMSGRKRVTGRGQTHGQLQAMYANANEAMADNVPRARAGLDTSANNDEGNDANGPSDQHDKVALRVSVR